MNLKKQLAMGIASGVLAVSLIGGGTYAYFSDTETSVNTFAAGTLDLSLNPTEIVNVDNIKPGDSMLRSFTLTNNGSLEIAKVLLKTDYTVTNKDGAEPNTEDFGEHIQVRFMWNDGNQEAPIIYEESLAKLKAMDPEALYDVVFKPQWKVQGLPAGQTDKLSVQFVFVDNGEDQNQFQGDKLELTWNFEAKQGEGIQIFQNSTK